MVRSIALGGLTYFTLGRADGRDGCAHRHQDWARAGEQDPQGAFLAQCFPYHQTIAHIIAPHQTAPTHPTKTKQSGADLVKKLYKMMIATDATLVEINPLAETNDGRVVAADAKLNFDDNAEYRQKGVFAKRDLTQEDPREVCR